MPRKAHLQGGYKVQGGAARDDSTGSPVPVAKGGRYHHHNLVIFKIRHSRGVSFTLSPAQVPSNPFSHPAITRPSPNTNLDKEWPETRPDGILSLVRVKDGAVGQEALVGDQQLVPLSALLAP